MDVIVASGEAYYQAVADANLQLRGLSQHLESSDDPELQQIGSSKLDDVLIQYNDASLQAALDELRNPVNSKSLPAAQNLKASVVNLLKHTNSSPLIAACDNNPFEVEMTTS